MSKCSTAPVIVHVIYSGVGGIASVFFSLAEASRNDKFRHAVAFYGIEPIPDDYISHCDLLGIEYHYFRRKPRIDFTVNNALYNWAKKLNPHAIIVNLPRALPPMARYKRTFPKTILIGVEHHANALKRPIDWIGSIAFMRHCTHTVYLTEVYKKEVASKIRGFFNPSKCVVIPNGINIEKFAPTPQKTKCNVLRIGTCGRLTQSKDIPTLIKAFAISKQSCSADTLTLTIAGDGPERNKLTTEVTSLQLEKFVSFEGFLTENELVSWFQSLDIYVQPTLSETMSTSIIQALSCGLPCVVSDLPGMSELVPPDTGYIVHTKKTQLFAEKISYLIQNKKERIRMGSAAREHAAHELSQSTTWKRYKNLLSQHSLS